MAHQTDNPARCRGFSLVELVMVLVIIGVFAAIAVPRFAEATARKQLDAAADRVIADLNKASTRARAASQTAAVRFRVDLDRYEADGTGGDTYTVQLDEPPYGVEITHARFGSTTTASFNAYGVPVETGSVTLTRGSNTVTVTLGSSGEATR